MIISYILVFLEGLLAFISPCILPMLPIYIMYLAGGTDVTNKKKLVINTLGFILGFTIVFVSLGAAATAVGRFMQEYKTLLEKISGIILILFGLNFMGILKIALLNFEKRLEADTKNLNFIKSIVFGAAFSFGWSTCLGSLLGSALMLAANKETVLNGMFMLFLFSVGLGIPFFITAMIFEKLSSVFTFIKRHFKIINIISGLILITTGLALFFGIFGYWASLFN